MRKTKIVIHRWLLVTSTLKRLISEQSRAGSLGKVAALKTQDLRLLSGTQAQKSDMVVSDYNPSARESEIT